MLTRLHVAHGFNVRDGGAATVDRLREHAEAAGLYWMEHDYGWLGVCGVMARATRIAREIARQVRPGDCALGHSSGCMELLEAAWWGAPFRRLVFVNPALDADSPLPEHVESVDVWHVPGDLAVSFARWLPFNRWGDMGARGYCGRDTRWHNHNARQFEGATYQDASGWWRIITFPRFNRHSRIFQHAEFFAPRIFAALTRGGWNNPQPSR